MVEKRKLILYFLFFSKIAPRWGQIGQSYLALGRAKLRKSSKVEFIGANSDFGGVEMVPVPPVLAQIVQNEPWWAKLALEKLGPIWLLGSIWLFSFYSADSLNDIWISKLNSAAWEANESTDEENHVKKLEASLYFNNFSNLVPRFHRVMKCGIFTTAWP